MNSHPVVLVILLCSLFLNYNGVKGGRLSLSEKEDLELEKKLKLLNKPALKTIQTDHGDIYDCVDFYQQPAFDHPLLKNHSFHFQMKPTSLPSGTRNEVLSSVTGSKSIRLKDGGCPVGTVPIRRITKEDLLRERLASKIRPMEAAGIPGSHYAVLGTLDSHSKFRGGGGTVSVYNLPVTDQQYSAARVKVQNGPDVLQGGWRVDPALYGDNYTRFFIHTDAGDTHCFNTRCPGFVITNTDIPLDFVIYEVSKRGKYVTETELYIVRDQPLANWWLYVGPNQTEVGFWPFGIFSGSGLGDMATYADWGGEVFSQPGIPKPPMGAGDNHLFRDTYQDAYFRRMRVLYQNGEYVDADDAEVFQDAEDFFHAEDLGIVNKDFGHLMVFGGAGGSTS